MHNIRPSNPVADNLESKIGFAVAPLRVVDGITKKDAAPFVEVLMPVGRADRNREGESFLFLVDPVSGESPQICRELRDVVRQIYWSASGSVTAALRRSIAVADRYLFEHNLNADRVDRCYVGLACAVLRGRDLFLLQAGPVWACVLQNDQLRCVPRGEKLAPMGISPVADVRLHHVFAAPGDALLLAPHGLLRVIGEQGLRRVLSLGDVDTAAAALVQTGSDDFNALIARCETTPESPVSEADALSTTSQLAGPAFPSRKPETARRTWRQEESGPRATGRPVPEHDGRAGKRRFAQDGALFVKKAFGKVGHALGRAASGAWHHLGNALGYLWHGLAAVATGLFALGRWLIRAMAISLRSTLPGTAGEASRRRHRHPPPKENHLVMTAIAAAIPVIILIAVLVAYREFAVQSRFRGFLNRAKEQIALAQGANGDTEDARRHWEKASQEIAAAAALRPEDPATQVLQDQTQEALDELDGIQRLTLTELADFGSSNLERRMVLTSQSLFVLDAAEGWVATVSLDPGGGEERENGEAQDPPVLVHTGQRVDGEDIGRLIDCAWVNAQGGRRSSSLLVLEEHHFLVSYDPAWRSEGGALQVSLVDLGSPPPGRSKAVGSYEGQFYVLDASADEGGQIWRYKPAGDAYPNEPERYFAAPPPRSLEQALDMAIDGHIYILYRDGTVAKFLGGESQPFAMQGIPGGLGEVAGFAVDPDGDSTVYIADRGKERVVVLSPEGRFLSQYRADQALTSLESLAVNQEDGRLYLLAEGRVYVGALP